MECKAHGCQTTKIKAFGLCMKHYLRQRRHGDYNYEPNISPARKEARRLGQATYFSGTPCINGHVAERTTDKGNCVICAIQRTCSWRKKRATYVRKKDRQRYRASPEKKLQRVRARRENNREYDREYAKLYRERNPGKRNANSARYRCAKIQRTPKWADQEAIEFFYECCPAGCHVDHIIPLQGAIVSGLHVASNLQWLSAAENCSKGNSYSLVPSSRLNRRRETGTETARTAE